MNIRYVFKKNSDKIEKVVTEAINYNSFAEVEIYLERNKTLWLPEEWRKVWVLVAQAMYKKNKLGLEEHIVNYLCKKYPTFPGVILSRAYILQRQGKMEEAKRLLEQNYEHIRNDVPSRIKYVRLLFNLALKRPEQRNQLLKKGLKENNLLANCCNRDAMLAYAKHLEIYAELSRDERFIREALRAYEKAKEYFPDSHVVCLSYGLLLMKHYPDREAYRDGLENILCARRLLEEQEAAMRPEKWEEEWIKVQFAYGFNVNQAARLKDLKESYDYSERQTCYDVAESAFKEILNKYPTHIETLSQYVFLLLSTVRLQDAEEQLEKLFNCMSSMDNHQTARTYRYMGWLKMESPGGRKEAVAYYEKSLKFEETEAALSALIKLGGCQDPRKVAIYYEVLRQMNERRFEKLHVAPDKREASPLVTVRPNPTATPYTFSPISLKGEQNLQRDLQRFEEKNKIKTMACDAEKKEHIHPGVSSTVLWATFPQRDKSSSSSPAVSPGQTEYRSRSLTCSTSRR